MSLAVAGALVVAVAATSAAFLLLVRSRAGRNHFLTDTTRGSAIFGVIGTAFAVVLAFVTLISFQTFNGAKEAADEEAVALVDLARTAQFFPPDQRGRIRGDLICYARSVAFDEWPLLEHGRRSDVVERWVTALRDAYGGLDTRTPKHQAAFAHVLEVTRARGDARRARLTAAAPSVPSPVWAVLLLGGLVTIMFVALFADRREPAPIQVALIVSVAVMVVAGLLLVRFLDHPYGGKRGSIEPTEMTRTISVLDRTYSGEPLCDPRGHPRK
jgi:hypothetical protein